VNSLEKHIELEEHSFKNNTTTYLSNTTSEEEHSITENGLVEQITILRIQHATTFKLETRFLRHTIGILIGTDTTQHLAKLFLY